MGFKKCTLQIDDAVLKSLYNSIFTLDLGDTLVIIDGKPEHFWWRGQNQRTFDIGDFPRKCVQNVAGKKAKDISKPLKNSFVHTGHGTRYGFT